LHDEVCWWLGSGSDVRFVRQFGTEFLQAIEFLDRAAVLALGMGLEKDQKSPVVGFLREAAEAFASGEITVLRAGDFDIAVAREIDRHGADGVAGVIESFVESGSEEAGFETGAAEDLVLADSHAFEREKFLRVYRFITGNQVGFEIGDVLQTFEADDCEG
jgi:hypothetical protein